MGEDRTPEGELTHLDARGHARMVDVGDKPASARTARARAELRMRPDTAARLAEGTLPKGDALAIARIAGIQAAKRTADLIPLCHHVALAGVDVEVDVDADEGRATVSVDVRAADRTGVEMEALTAASVAALALYDLLKAVERGVVIGEVALVEKTGGTRGDWRAEGVDDDAG
ncbi:cyclic pyranopterin monophosphate synthase MoaC [Egibacter rhizosphaerae]|uniref:Cyclic pyranopterin monophosphate synthase n=1 Tax=Egibacter rhizosphaerae TaxID=1670831 RepID=A0A411YIW4_9ACTN|nr:cyclic pyranopterin monophosphate synthase MoaC [Egibacter rhizosphaerae]QBI21091.1 cyclic pyranopterin monophosphate synthase MoaC [Egibacter rhizosphaerae]